MTEISPLTQIPDYLQHQRRWTVFKKIWNEERKKFDKYPCTPTGGKPYAGYPNVENSNDFANFADIRKLCELDTSFAPAYYLLKKDRILFLDFDAPCKEPHYPTYTEISISGGYHVLGFFDGAIPVLKDTKEVYQDRRWIVMTGNTINGNRDINDITNAIIDRQGPAPANSKASFKVPDSIGEMRNTTLFKYACSMRERGSSHEAIEAALLIENKVRCKPPLEEKEVRSIAKSACKYEPGNLVPTLAQGKPAYIKPQIIQDDLSTFKQPDNPRLTVNLENNFISEYIKYINRLSDSYLEYQHGAALMLLSVAVNKRAYLPLTIGTIYPNMWIFNLGQSTISRKTTACSKLTDFIELQNQWMLLSYPGSPEAFIEDLEGEDRVNGPDNLGHGVLCKDEAASILASMEKSFMADMRDLFCQLYDCRPFQRKLRTSQRKKKSFFNLKDTYLCLFFATTPDVFATYTTISDLTSGWLLRFLYYFPNYERKLRDLGSMDDEDRHRQNAIGKRISTLSLFFRNHEIEFQFSIAGRAFYNDWVRQHLDKMQHEKQEDRGMFERLSIYALKMAMLYTIGRDAIIPDLHPDAPRIIKMDIDDGCLHLACEHIDSYFLPVSKIVFETVGRNEDKNTIEKIMGTVKRAGGKISRIDLMKRAHLTKKVLDEAIDTLIESTEIKEVQNGGQIWYTF